MQNMQSGNGPGAEQLASGKEKIEWVKNFMPLLTGLEAEFSQTQPLQGLRVTLSIHLEAKTAYLAQVLQAAGAQVSATGCNPLSTQDDVAAALAESGVAVFARHGADETEYTNHLKRALAHKPHVIIDDGGDLVALLHSTEGHLAENLIGGCEETTTGVMRLHARHGQGALKFPMIDVNDAECKHFFDNRYGTGQSVWDGIMRTTNVIIAGRTVVVAGYGWCGKGIAKRALGMGARVVVTEVNPISAIEAVMDGCQVMSMAQAAQVGDIFVTVTGCRDVIRKEHMLCMKPHAILCNAGHFDVEVSKTDLEAIGGKPKRVRKNIEGYTRSDGTPLYLLAEGRLVNLAAGDGHPAEIMDMSFALQALSVVYMAQKGRELPVGVHMVPKEIDREVAARKLRAMGITIDALSEEQQAYVNGWGE